eukprot:2093599-Alexandrium_andersonii.AAC.1
MSASLVGSEMCIRDRRQEGQPGQSRPAPADKAGEGRDQGKPGAAPRPVSYTHLTLPTICSV